MLVRGVAAAMVVILPRGVVCVATLGVGAPWMRGYSKGKTEDECDNQECK